MSLSPFQRRADHQAGRRSQADLRPSDPSRAASFSRFTLTGAAALVLTLGFVSAVALARGDGTDGHRQAVALAAITTGCGALGGWFVARMGRGAAPATAVGSVLGAILVRIAPPLAALAWLTRPGSPPHPAAAGMLVGFYLALWAVDLLLHVAARDPGRSGAGREAAD